MSPNLALAYGPVLELLEDLLAEDLSGVVEMAIKQFVFNVRAVVLHEYDRELEIVTHLDGYAARGDHYVMAHWEDIAALEQSL